MNWKKLLALFILLVAVGAFYFWDQKQIEEKEAQEEQSKQLFSWKIDDVAAFNIKGLFQTIALKKVNDVWELVNPVEATADQEAVKTLLEKLQDAKLDSTITDTPEDLKYFGLERPQLVFTAEDSEGKALGKISIGDELPTKSYFYATVDDASKVIAVPTLIKSTVEKEPSDLRDKDVFHVVQDKIEKLDVAYPDGRRFVVSKEGDDWRLEEPISADADSTTITNFLGRVDRLKVKEFVAEKVGDASPYGLVEGVTTVTVFEQDRAEPVVLHLGSFEKSQSAYNARMEGKSNVISIESAFVDALPKQAFDWRPKKPMPIWDYQAQYAKVEKPGAGTLLELVKDEEKHWNMIEPVSAEYEALDTSTISTFLNQKLHDFEIVKYVTDTLDQAGLISPAYIITVSGEVSGEHQTHTLLLGKEDKDGYLVYGKKASSDEVFVGNNDIMRILEEPFTRFLINPPEMEEAKSPGEAWLSEVQSATDSIPVINNAVVEAASSP